MSDCLWVRLPSTLMGLGQSLVAMGKPGSSPTRLSHFAIAT